MSGIWEEKPSPFSLKNMVFCAFWFRKKGGFSFLFQRKDQFEKFKFFTPISPHLWNKNRNERKMGEMGVNGFIEFPVVCHFWTKKGAGTSQKGILSVGLFFEKQRKDINSLWISNLKFLDPVTHWTDVCWAMPLFLQNHNFSWKKECANFFFS